MSLTKRLYLAGAAGSDSYLQPFRVEQQFVVSRWLRGKNATIPPATTNPGNLNFIELLDPQLSPG